MDRLKVFPCSFAVARAFILAKHRHHRPPVGHKFSLACWLGAQIVGVAVVGRPVSRILAAQGAQEVTRLATDGTRNACSILYAAARSECCRRGVHRLVTYTRSDESGASLRALGLRDPVLVRGRHWDCPSRHRRDTTEIIDRWRWELL